MLNGEVICVFTEADVSIKKNPAWPLHIHFSVIPWVSHSVVILMWVFIIILIYSIVYSYIFGTAPDIK